MVDELCEQVMFVAESDAGERDVLLEGGPGDISRGWHVDREIVEYAKVPCRSGTAHYEFSVAYRGLGGRRLPVFRWEYTTKVAE